MLPPDPLPTKPSRGSWFAALGAVAATFFYFLIFAEFGFLELAHAMSPGGGVRILMLALGAGGVVGSICGAKLFRREAAQVQLTGAFLACAASAAFAVMAPTPVVLAIAAVTIGVSLGWLTVVLTASLRCTVGNASLGLCIGGGTGLAYAASNVPWLFHASATMQTISGGLVVAAASFLPRFMSPSCVMVPRRSHEFAAGSVARWTTVLLLLVWLDSAAFYVVQHDPALRGALWQNDSSLFANAATHLLAALGAGALLDQNRRIAVVGAALAALSFACLMLGDFSAGPAFVGLSYTGGVSLYSTVLIEYPARSDRPNVAATIFAISGWMGSALGIGMAQDLHAVPTVFVAIAATVIVAALGWRPAVRSTALIIAALLLIDKARAGESDDIISRGREVYIAEGCIHCHSQYIRPRVQADVDFWGPAKSLADARVAAPPLFGTRRQGPDLSQVGNRRSPEWNRLHLIEASAVSPGSRMPSYAHLFTDSDRGDALVAYLASLGGESLPARQIQIAAWRPMGGEVVSTRSAEKLFLQICAQCHGPTGRGDGQLVNRLSLRPADWTLSPWRHAQPSEPLELALCRIIKFGLPGLPMAGHEYLPDREIVGLAQHVQTLHNSPTEARCRIQQ